MYFVHQHKLTSRDVSLQRTPGVFSDAVYVTKSGKVKLIWLTSSEHVYLFTSYSVFVI